MKLIKVVKSISHQCLSINLMSYGDYRVVHSSKKGYRTKDYATLPEAEKYAKRLANLITI